MPQYETVWVKGMGDGLAQHIQSLLNSRNEKGWRPLFVIPDDAGVQHGAIVVLVKP